MTTDATHSAKRHYTTVAKFLHWLVAGAILLQYVLANLAESAEESGERVSQLALLANHKSVGMTVLLLAFARIAWRAANRAPALPGSMPGWQKACSHVSHAGLYLLMFAVPLTGWLMSSASAYSVSWFNLFQFPDLIGASPDAKDLLNDAHELLAKILFVLVLVHVAAAFKHALFNRDGVMSRMTSGPALGAFGAVLAAGLFFLARTGSVAADAGAAQSAPEAAPSEPAAEATASSLPLWNIDPAASYIEFSGDQAGARFTGRWGDFDAQLRFAANQLEQARFKVTVDTTTPQTGDAERDSTMQDADWFDVANYPTAVFRADRFKQRDGTFVADGQLLIKQRSRGTELTFTVRTDGARRVLDGRATLDRLDFKLGTGEWSDPTWVGREVDVRVHIEATVTP